MQAGRISTGKAAMRRKYSTPTSGPIDPSGHRVFPGDQQFVCRGIDVDFERAI